MDTSDESYEFQNYPYSSTCEVDWLNEKKKYFDNKYKEFEQVATDCFCKIRESEGKITHYLKPNFQKAQEKLSDLKADLATKSNKVKEDLEKVKILETKSRNIESKVSEEEDISNLMREVLTLEDEKKQRMESHRKRRDATIKWMANYKIKLDCHLTYTEPDLFTFYFKRLTRQGEELPDKWIQLQTIDFVYWQFINASVPEQEKKHLAEVLERTCGSVPHVLCEARKICFSH